MLSIGIASTGVLTFAYFSIASHVLGEVDAKRVDLLWSIMFVIISVIYRPIEQLLSRTIADRRARGHVQHSVRVPIAIQAGFAATFLVVALALHEQLIDNVFDHYAAHVLGARGRHARLRRQLLRAWLVGGARVLRAVRGAGADGVDLAAVLRAGGGDRHHKRTDRCGARHRRGAVRLARGGAGGVLAPHERATGRPRDRGAGRRAGGSGDRGRRGGGRRRRALVAARLGLRLRGVGRDALRADASERCGA